MNSNQTAALPMGLLKADKDRRVIAALIDLGLAFGIFGLVDSYLANYRLYVAGVNIEMPYIAALVYLLFRDAFFQGRSVGKLLCRIRVVDIATGKPCNFYASFIRNGVFYGIIYLALTFVAVLSLILSDHVSEAMIERIISIGGSTLVAVVISLSIFVYRGLNSADGRTVCDVVGKTYVTGDARSKRDANA